MIPFMAVEAKHVPVWFISSITDIFKCFESVVCYLKACCCILYVACCLLPVALKLVACCLLPIACCLLFVVCCLEAWRLLVSLFGSSNL
jgi:hypothetical protein